jgi:hypothetical protein
MKASKTTRRGGDCAAAWLIGTPATAARRTVIPTSANAVKRGILISLGWLERKKSATGAILTKDYTNDALATQMADVESTLIGDIQ